METTSDSAETGKVGRRAQLKNLEISNCLTGMQRHIIL